MTATRTVNAALLALAGSSGCGAIAVLEEGSGGAGGASVTTGTSGSIVATSTVSKSGSSQTGMPDLCQAPVGAPCDPATFPQCEAEQVSGIPCCHISKSCGPSGVEWEPAACTDDCAQNCELIQNPEHCEAVPWCALGTDGCEFAAPPP